MFLTRWFNDDYQHIQIETADYLSYLSQNLSSLGSWEDPLESH